ncbi:chromosome partitioning protein ParA [Vibrio tasmaniensis]|nr:chromosome partitioning protein ParA [Vibrio tasmaniensis]
MKKQIKPFEYLSGIEFTDNLKRLTKTKTNIELSELVAVPKQTFSTWNTHNRTSHELMVRLSLALNIPLEQLALKPEDRHATTFDVSTDTIVQRERKTSPQHETVILPSVCLSDGKLINTGEIPYALRRINKYDLADSDVIEVETSDGIYLVNQDIVDAVSGKYLIDIDGHLSINPIQRLPGKKLAIAFGDTTMEVSEEDIKVVGRVAVVLEKV